METIVQQRFVMIQVVVCWVVNVKGISIVAAVEMCLFVMVQAILL